MPTLDYRTLITAGGRPAPSGARFYDGTEGRELTPCPTCRCPQDPLFPHDPADTPGCGRLGRENAALKAELANREQWQRDRVAKRAARNARRREKAHAAREEVTA